MNPKEAAPYLSFFDVSAPRESEGGHFETFVVSTIPVRPETFGLVDLEEVRFLAILALAALIRSMAPAQ